MNNNHFTILMTGYNSISWIKISLYSALNQKYDNFDVIAMDALTNDGTYEYIKSVNDKRLQVIRNDKRKYQVENIEIGVKLSKPKTIIVSLDFDDWLSNENVLKTVNEVYNNTKCWMTYGTYIEHPTRKVNHLYHSYPDEVIKQNTYRKHRWLASHLRTFKKDLFLKINTNDFIDPQTNKYWDMAGDQAFMIPMLEMSREKAVYIPNELYVYNRTNSLSEDRINCKHQEDVSRRIRNKQPYERLESL